MLSKFLPVGKQIRLKRIADPSGFVFNVPMDHGLTLGPVKGLSNLSTTTKQVFEGGASCVIIQKGMARSIFENIPSDRGLIIHVSGSVSMSPSANQKILTGSVSSALNLAADAISCHVNIGNEGDSQMISDLNYIVEEAALVEMPVLAMMYARDNEGTGKVDVDSLKHIARIAEELGADLVKINTTENAVDFEEVTQGINIPIIVAGGSVQDNFGQFIKVLEKSILAGASGVSVGRNVFQSANPKEAISRIRDAIISLSKEVDHVQAFH